MIFHVRYHDRDGFVQVWMNGKRVVNYSGPLGTAAITNRFYHKIGLYRDKMPDPMTIYFDNYRTGPTTLSVDPARLETSDQ